MYVEYSSNNSGGSWWLDDDDWLALEKAGWKVVWANLDFLYSDKGGYIYDSDGTPKLVPVGQGNSRFESIGKREVNGEWRYMGQLATTAYRVGLSLREAAEEWEQVTKGTATDAGCPCCGQPHNFTEYDDNGDYVASGPDTCYSAAW